jgi:hypothetical protein
MPVRLSAYDSTTSGSKKFSSTVQVIYEPMLAASSNAKGDAFIATELYDVSLVFKDSEVGYGGASTPSSPDQFPPGPGETNFQLTWRGVKIGKHAATLEAALECRMPKTSTERWSTLTAFATLPGNASSKPRIESAVERVAYVHICPWK